MAEPSAPSMDGTVRRALLGLFVFGSLGTGTELLLLEHMEKRWQPVPLVLLALGLVFLAAHVLASSRLFVRLFQGAMLLFLAGGVAGTLLHFRGNVEFEEEMHPDGTRWELFRGALQGATPTLAPGTMILLGAIGLLYAYRHPVLDRSAGTGGRSEDT
jgi:hypothetical protein